MTTPLEISILIHYYCCAGDFPNYHAPAQKEAIEKFVRIGLLQEDDYAAGKGEARYYANREALELYINTLTAVPLPKQKWVIEK